MDSVNKKTGEIKDDPMQGMSSYNEKGEELPNSTPLELPVGFSRPQTLQERMRYLLRSEELKRALESAGEETFEEADDFDVEEQDPLEGTPYEDDFEPDIPGLAAREQEIRAGAVLDRPIEKKEKAREITKKWKNYRKTGSSGKSTRLSKPKADEKGSDEGDGDDD